MHPLSSSSPLAVPQAIGDTAVYALLVRYDLRPLLPISTLEYQLAQVMPAWRSACWR